MRICWQLLQIKKTLHKIERNTIQYAGFAPSKRQNYRIYEYIILYVCRLRITRVLIRGRYVDVKEESLL